MQHCRPCAQAAWTVTSSFFKDLARVLLETFPSFCKRPCGRPGSSGVLSLQRISMLSAGELLYGRAGAIYALLFARQHTKMKTAATQQLVSQLLQQILAEGQRTAQQLSDLVQVQVQVRPEACSRTAWRPRNSAGDWAANSRGSGLTGPNGMMGVSVRTTATTDPRLLWIVYLKKHLSKNSSRARACLRVLQTGKWTHGRLATFYAGTVLMLVRAQLICNA